MKQKPGLTPSPQYNFAGGLVTMVAKTRLRPSQLTRAKNINLLVDGEFEVRKGYAKAISTAFGTEIDRFIHMKTDTANVVVAYGGTYVKYFVDPSWTTLSSAMPDTGDYRSMVIANDMLFIGSASGVKKWLPGQSVLWNAGITKPAAKCVPAENGAGNLSGTYRWYWTYYNSTTDEESDPSPISDELVVTDKQVTLSSFTASTDPQVDKIRIYRNSSGVSDAWYYVGQKNNDTNNFADNVHDDNLGAELSFKNAVPPSHSPILLWHMNRMWYVDGSKLTWSEPYKPGSVPDNNHQYIEKGDGGTIVAIAASYGNVVVLKNTGIYCFFFDATNPTNSTYEPIAKTFGCAAPMSVCNVGEDIIFLSPEGLKKITNAGTVLSGIEVLVEGEFGAKSMPAVANLVRDTQPSTVNRAVGIYYENKNQYHLSMPYYAPGNNDLTIVWCIDSNAFVTHEDFYVRAAALYKSYDRELIYRSHNDEYIYLHDYGYTDDGASISFEVQTGFHAVDEIKDEKRIRLFFPILRGADTAQITCEIIKDFEPKGSGFQTTFTHYGASYWGQAHWGQNYWGASGEYLYRRKARVRGRLFSTRFFGTTNLSIGCTGYQFYYQPRAL